MKWQKNAFCQEKSAFRNRFTVDDSGLERWNNMVKLSLVFGSTLSWIMLALCCVSPRPNSVKTASSKHENWPIHVFICNPFDLIPKPTLLEQNYHTSLLKSTPSLTDLKSFVVNDGFINHPTFPASYHEHTNLTKTIRRRWRPYDANTPTIQRQTPHTPPFRPHEMTLWGLPKLRSIYPWAAFHVL